MEDQIENGYLLRDLDGPILNPVSPLSGVVSLHPTGILIPERIDHRWTHLFKNFAPQEHKWLIIWCKRTGCRYCINPEAYRIERSIQKFVDDNPAPNWFFLTLSTPNRMDLGQAFAELTESFDRLIRDAGKDEFHHWNLLTSWIGVTEIKLGKNGFNVHRHIIAGTEAFRLPYAQCHEEWNRASQCKAAHYNLKKIHHPLQKNIRYLSKYMTKDFGWGGLDQSTHRQVEGVLKGRRRITRSRGASNLRPVIEPWTPKEWIYCCEQDYEGECANVDMGPINRP